MSKALEMKKLLSDYLKWQVSRLKTMPLGKKEFRALVKAVEEFIVKECDNATTRLRLRAPDGPPPLPKAREAKLRLVTRKST